MRLIFTWGHYFRSHPFVKLTQMFALIQSLGLKKKIGSFGHAQMIKVSALFVSQRPQFSCDVGSGFPFLTSLPEVKIFYHQVPRTVMMVVIFRANFTGSKLLLQMVCHRFCNNFPTMPTQEHGVTNFFFLTCNLPCAKCYEVAEWDHIHMKKGSFFIGALFAINNWQTIFCSLSRWFSLVFTTWKSQEPNMFKSKVCSTSIIWGYSWIDFNSPCANKTWVLSVLT